MIFNLTNKDLNIIDKFLKEFDEKNYLNNFINFIIKDIALMQMNLLIKKNTCV